MDAEEVAVMLEAACGAKLLEVLAEECIERGTASPEVLRWLKGVQEVVARRIAGCAAH